MALVTRLIGWLNCVGHCFQQYFSYFAAANAPIHALPEFFFTSTRQNILSKPLTAFLNNHCWNNGQRWERNESCRNDYHQSSERILAEPGIEPLVTSMILLVHCFQVTNTHAHTRAHTHAHTRARTQARTHTRTHAHPPQSPYSPTIL